MRKEATPRTSSGSDLDQLGSWLWARANDLAPFVSGAAATGRHGGGGTGCAVGVDAGVVPGLAAAAA